MLFEKLDRIVVAVNDIQKAMKDFNHLLGVQYYGVHEDQEVGLKVSLPKNLGLELIAPIGEESCGGSSSRSMEKD